MIRYLLREFNHRGWSTRLHAGSLGAPGEPSHGGTFYGELDLCSFDYNDARSKFESGADSLAVDNPFHPSYEDRGHSPDPIFSAVPPSAAQRLTAAWCRHLKAHGSERPELLHLHHLSHLQTAVRSVYPEIPVLTTLHGTELKLISGMRDRLLLSERMESSPEKLAVLLAHANADRQREANRLAARFRLSDQDRDLLVSTKWEKWRFSGYWLAQLRGATALAGHLVAVSEHDAELAERLLHLNGRDLTVITNGVDIRHFRVRNLTTQARIENLRRWLVEDPRAWEPGGPEGSIRYTEADLARIMISPGKLRPLLLWVGRFLDFKRIPVLLRAFAQLRNRVRPFPALLLWGGYPGEYEGTHPADLAREIGIDQDVYHLGWRGHAELPEGLNTADLMVAPAVNEPFGMVYLEAMACGTAPIATASGGPARIIKSTGNRANGWLARPDDVEDLAEVLVAALTHDTERVRRAANAARHVQARYSWEKVADNYAEAYARACGKADEQTT